MKAIHKEFWMEVRKSKARFLSIFFIVALGVAFFAGIQAASPDMRVSGDAYFDDNELMDVKVMGTLGLTEEDVTALSEVEGVEYAEGAYSTDVICKLKEAEQVLHMESINQKLNFLEVEDGNIPKKSGELFLDQEFAASCGIQVGDKLILEEDGENEFLVKHEYIVSGIGTSPLYISLSRGNTTLGSGEVNGFAYVLPEDFDQEIYTQIYVRAHGSKDVVSYTDAYESLVERLEERVEAIEAECCQARYDSIMEEAMEELSDAKKELEDGRKEAEEELSDAEKELTDGEKELEDGRKELEDGKKELADGKKELEDGRKELEDGKKELADGKKELEDGRKELEDGKTKLSDAKNQVAQGRSELNKAKTELNAGWTEFYQQEKTLNNGIAEYEQGQKDLADGQKKLAESRKTLTENQKKIEQGLKDIAAGEKTIKENEAQLQAQEKECQAGLAQVAAGEEQLLAGEAELNAAKEQLAQLQTQLSALQTQKSQLEQTYQEMSGREEVSEEELAAVEQQLVTVREQEAQLLAQVTAFSETLTAQETELGAQKTQLAATRKQLEDALLQIEAGFTELEVKKAELKASKEELQKAQKEITAGWKTIETEEKKIEAAKKQLTESKATLDEGKKQLEAGRQELLKGQQAIEANEATLVKAENEIKSNEATLLKAEQEILKAEQEIADGEQEIEENEKKLLDGEKEIKENEEKLADAEKELADGEKELEDGRKEYEEAKAEVEQELADAEKEIADAEQEISEIEIPEWIISDRNNLPEYADYGDNADRIRNIGRVFPVIFFLVAALISLTTMTRMVEEQRTQIGTMKALGYGKLAIASKYLSYAFLATVGGSILGVLIGEKIIPLIIIKAYGIMYKGMSNTVVIDYEFKFALIASLAAVCCTIGAALFSCYKALMETPASLMRPPAPKVGKRVLIERIPFIWKHLNFTWKSTMRNMFRYKKRFFMTIFGISGSMALLLVGFGLQDSIMDIVMKQYAELQHYDGMIIKDEDAKEEEEELLKEHLSKETRISHYMNVQLNSMEVQNGKSQLSVYVYVPEEPEKLSEDVTLRDRKTKEPVAFTDEGAVISEKTSSLLGKTAGDTLVIKKDHQEYEVLITGITENYMGHYIYMMPEYYEAVFKEAPEYMTVMFTAKEEDQIEDIGNEVLRECEAALSISYISSLEGQLKRMLSTLSSVIVVLIVSAGMLAFVVLYNLNNINITERQRELATLKVLGFHDKEVSAYVFRENILLTIIGIGFGILFGIFLHRFIIVTVEVDTVMFGREIRTISYLYGALFTAGFSMFVNMVMHYKLKKIDMVESLKSVE